jgi:hypothetical protein
MKFNKSITWQNLNKFDESMRTSIDSLLLFYVIQYFQRRSILEIGFRQGYSFGLMLEASPPDAVLEAVDVMYPEFTIFDMLKTNKETKLYTIQSQKFVSARQYDFINVDGHHGYKEAKVDILNAIDHLSPDGILMVDDYGISDVDRAITDILQMNLGIKPFLKGIQEVFFVRNNSCLPLNTFEVEFLHSEINDFCNVTNTSYKNYNVVDIWCKHVYIKYPHIFAEVVKTYNL